MTHVRGELLDAVYDILTSYGITDMLLPGRIYNEIPTIAGEIIVFGLQTTVEVDDHRTPAWSTDNLVQ